ncbi:hypothetical protein EII22_08920 [Coriobacteriales bacterium OH1046]|nr:hypothetical protein EII22_08920 [Coriobacteriales bacterium OH1046]
MARRGKPELPGSFDFCDATREWYAAWRSSRCTDGWDMRQWNYMFDTAIVHSLVYGSYDFSWLAELRARLTQMGLEFE